METQLNVKPLNQCRVLLVEGEPISNELECHILSTQYQCTSVANAEEALVYCQQHQPDLILIDAELPSMGGVNLCNMLREQPHISDVPVIFLTNDLSSQTQKQCWQAGAVDVFIKPLAAVTLLNRTKTHLLNSLRMRLLEQLTHYDHLTNVHNRYFLAHEGKRLILRCMREKQNLCAAMLDIDFFKSYNDRYGHQFGDECLRQVAQTIRSCLLRPSDYVIRFGGEEFLILIANTDDMGCHRKLNQIVSSINELNLTHAGSPLQRVTATIGYSFLGEQVTSFKQLIKHADSQLYLGKHQGKNRVCGGRSLAQGSAIGNATGSVANVGYKISSTAALTTPVEREKYA